MNRWRSARSVQIRDINVSVAVPPELVEQVEALIAEQPRMDE